MYESSNERPISLARFAWRLALHFAAAWVFVLGSLGLGMAGYEYYEHLDWRDAFLNAAMLLGGMGPVETPQTPGGKIFAGVYALYAGIVFLIFAGVMLAPVIHRVLHHFHWEGTDER
jgi:hypothetical protein